MPAEIYLVKVGMTMHEGTVEEWYVADGERVEIGALLYRLETEKVNLDVDAEASGIVKHLVAEGTTLAPGDVVGYVYADGEPIPEVLPKPTAKLDAPSVDTPAKPMATPAPGPKAGRVAASPAARKLAAELGIDLGTVIGSGPRGRITREDVLNANEAPSESPPSDVDATAAQVVTAATTVPLRGMRKTIAERMHASLRESAQLTMDMEVAMDDAIKLRANLIDEWQQESIRVTYTDLVIVASARALARHPAMNAAVAGDTIARFDAAHVGLAVALDDGLIVPVIKDAGRKSLKQVAVESQRLAARAREGALTLADVEGGTFTVTSLGMYGVDTFTPILNSGQAGILGVGRIYDSVRWDDDRPHKAASMRLSLTWDHRVLDGAPAAEFLGTVRDLLEAAFRLLV